MNSFLSKNIKKEKNMLSSSKSSGKSKNKENLFINNNMNPNIQISSNEKNNGKKIDHRNKNKSDMPIKQNYSEDIDFYDNNTAKTRQISLTSKNNPVIIKEIEYEKILNNQIIIDENDNFNVYYMKPVFKSKTIVSTKKKFNNLKFNSNNNPNILAINNLSNRYINYNEDENPYNDDNYNSNNTYPQFEQRNLEIMPLENNNKEKIFKTHLVQRLKAYKIKQADKSKIPLNIASKMRREESLRNSLKHLLAIQSEIIDKKKELMYYKGYFRFWKKKSKIMMVEGKSKKRIKKDRNIRITTVIYKAEKPNMKKKLNQKVLIENINKQKEIEKIRQNLINNLEHKQQEKLRGKSNENSNYNKYFNDITYDINFNNNNNNHYSNNMNIDDNLNVKNDIYKQQNKRFNSNKDRYKKTVPKEINEKMTNAFIEEIIKKENQQLYDYDINNLKESLKKSNININNDKDKRINDVRKTTKNDNKKKEALGIITKFIEKEIKKEGFNQLKNDRNRRRQKGGAEKIKNFLEKKELKAKEEIMHEFKQNQNKSKISEALDKINNFIINKINQHLFEGFQNIKEFYVNYNENNKQDNNEINNNINNENNIKDYINNNIININANGIDESNSNKVWTKKIMDWTFPVQNQSEQDSLFNSMELDDNDISKKNDNNNQNKEKNIIDNNNEGKEKWTINKLNWQIADLNKENESLFGLSEDDLKNSKIKNSLSIHNSQKINNNSNSINNINNHLIEQNHKKDQDIKEGQKQQELYQSKELLSYRDSEFNDFISQNIEKNEVGAERNNIEEIIDDNLNYSEYENNDNLKEGSIEVENKNNYQKENIGQNIYDNMIYNENENGEEFSYEEVDDSNYNLNQEQNLIDIIHNNEEKFYDNNEKQYNLEDEGEEHIYQNDNNNNYNDNEDIINYKGEEIDYNNEENKFKGEEEFNNEEQFINGQNEKEEEMIQINNGEDEKGEQQLYIEEEGEQLYDQEGGEQFNDVEDEEYTEEVEENNGEEGFVFINSNENSEQEN